MFLDREMIPIGSNWRRDLQYEIGGTTTFLCILDEISVMRPWVAAEFCNAMRGQTLTGSPRVITLEKPGLNLEDALPVFVQALSADDPEGSRLHAVRRIRVSRRTVEVLASELHLSRFRAATIFPQTVAMLFQLALIPISGLCAFAAMLGIAAWAGWVEEMWNDMRFLHWLPRPAALVLLFFAAYLAGSGLRLTMVSQFQARTENPGALTFVQGFGTLGLLLFCAAWLHAFSPFVVGWALVLAALGWWRAGEFFTYSVVGDPRVARS